MKQKKYEKNAKKKGTGEQSIKEELGVKKKQEECEWKRGSFRRIDAASLRWDQANSTADRGSQVSSRWLMH